MRNQKNYDSNEDKTHLKKSSKKKLPAWAIALIILGVTLIIFSVVKRVVKIRRRSKSGVDYILQASSQKNKQRLSKHAQRKRKEEKKKNFKNQYRNELKAKRIEFPEEDAKSLYQMVAIDELSNATNKGSLDIEKYEKIKNNLPSGLENTQMIKVKIESLDKSLSNINKSMSEYVQNTQNPTLIGAVAYIQKEPIQTLTKRKGRNTDNYTNAYKDLYQKALKQKENLKKNN